MGSQNTFLELTVEGDLGQAESSMNVLFSWKMDAKLIKLKKKKDKIPHQKICPHIFCVIHFWLTYGKMLKIFNNLIIANY